MDPVAVVQRRTRSYWTVEPWQ